MGRFSDFVRGLEALGNAENILHTQRESFVYFFCEEEKILSPHCSTKFAKHFIMGKCPANRNVLRRWVQILAR